jgi:hypothetical protein
MPAQTMPGPLIALGATLLFVTLTQPPLAQLSFVQALLSLQLMHIAPFCPHRLTDCEVTQLAPFVQLTAGGVACAHEPSGLQASGSLHGFVSLQDVSAARLGQLALLGVHTAAWRHPLAALHAALEPAACEKSHTP